ncbi:hypothetical protein [Micromonospora sp. WMMD987]|uniref:hypothetical protein n=1 Tax=Micromonospora sp. WMMD987 TaxID=3016089 RepID=UPI00249CC1AE|nr:hypothetical protein [Micromonospora sp. WMMD987]WFE94506.1 hypothetical protein O7612_24700 [Micromonospora sp. WMMD987]
MNPATISLTALAFGTLLGITLGIPLGRRVERLAWYADATIARARITGWLLRDLSNWLLAAALVVAVAVFVLWALLRSHR